MEVSFKIQLNLKAHLRTIKIRMIEAFFYYFAFGSNLLQQRIQLRNPSAEYIGVGRLDNYRLDFVARSSNWLGSVATIQQSSNASESVFGTVWRLAESDKASLDKQESCPVMYSAMQVDVALMAASNQLSNDEETPSSKILSCRTYQNNSTASGRPSPYYLDIVLRGAVQSKLPSSYIENLKATVKHNACFDQCPLYMEVYKSLPSDERDKFQVPELRHHVIG